MQHLHNSSRQALDHLFQRCQKYILSLITKISVWFQYKTVLLNNMILIDYVLFILQFHIFLLNWLKKLRFTYNSKSIWNMNIRWWYYQTSAQITNRHSIQEILSSRESNKLIHIWYEFIRCLDKETTTPTMYVAYILWKIQKKYNIQDNISLLIHSSISQILIFAYL